jgi:molecular chaperone Hsp33
VEAVCADASLGQSTPPALLSALFPADELRLGATRPVRFRCSCSRPRAANALRIAGRDEIEAVIAADGRVEVRCEFCDRVHAFDAAAARALFDAGVTATAAPMDACANPGDDDGRPR